MKRLFFLFAVLVTSYGYAQTGEGGVAGNCGDGVDNDGDGFIDCYDGECYNDAKCADFFIGKDASCDAKPDSFPPFSLAIKYVSPAHSTMHLSRSLVGDVDNDGVTEIVTVNRTQAANNNDAAKNPDQAGSPGDGSYINIFEAKSNGTLVAQSSIDLWTVDKLAADYQDIAMADVDNDKYAELFILTRQNGGGSYKIACYSVLTGKQVWVTGTIGFPGQMAIADFDADGKAELYTSTKIYDALTGVQMGSYAGRGNAPIAANIDATSPGLELINGCAVFKVVINRVAMTATSSPLKSEPNYFVRSIANSGATSVADFNQDGHLDVLAVGSYGADNANTTIFFWDYFNSALKYYQDPDNWGNGAGRINVADIDGDTLMNAVYVSGSRLVALREVTTGTGLDAIWRDPVTENTSGYTGCTMFDFNADGKSEIVYRDEENLYIYTSSVSGTTYSYVKSVGQKCQSRTAFEYPIVADIDNDGHADICVACASQTAGFTGAGHKIFDDAEVRVFQSGDPINAPWVPARKVWNQHGYFIVNVNDDLSIPKNQQANELIFTGHAPCKLGGRNRPFNSFLNQAPYTNSLGCPQYAAPNLTYVTGSMVINPPRCPDKDFKLLFTIKNLGNKAISGNVPISFYSRNPFKSTTGAKLYNTVKVNLVNLVPGASFTTDSLTVKGNGSADSLWVVMNDAGTSKTFPITLPNTSFIECDYDNGIPTYVTPKPAPLTTTSTPSIFCAVETAPYTGSVTASVKINGVDRTGEFDYYWSAGAAAKPVPADFKGVTWSQKQTGQYTVYGVNKVANCGTTTVTQSVSPDQYDITAEAFVIKADDNCKTPNGVLNVVVKRNGVVDPSTNFTYAWYKSSEFLSGTIISTADTAKVLIPTQYTVQAVDKKSGCKAIAPQTVPDARPKMKVTETHVDITCSATSGGTINSTLTVNGSVVNPPTGYNFKWYKGKKVKPGAPDFTTQNIGTPPLAAGDYTLVVVDGGSSSCTSDTLTATIKQTLPPSIVSVTQKHTQTSCIIAPAPVSNGEAEVALADTTKYTYEWFVGQNTLAANKINRADAKFAHIKKLAAGTYTVLVTDPLTGCTSSGEVTILDDTAPIAITPSAVANSTCKPHNGSITITGVPASGSAIGDYTFFIDDGSNSMQQTGNATFSPLNFGTYNVWAFNNVTKCKTQVKQQTVANTIPTLTINPIVTQPAADCHAGKGDLKVDASGGSNSFNFEWFTGGDTIPSNRVFTESGVATSALLQTQYGNYTIKVEDAASHCKSVVQQFLPIANSHVLTTTGIDLDKCIPLTAGSVDAKLTVTTTLAPTFTFTQDDYKIQVYTGTSDPDPDEFLGIVPFATITPTGAMVTNTYTTSGIFDATSYTFVATCIQSGSPTEGCRVSSTVNLKRVTTNPVINNTVINNFKCVPKNGGEIDLQVGTSAADNNPMDYTFVWSGGTPGGANGEKDLSLTPGNYTVKATFSNPAKKNEGCSSTASIPVLDVPQLINITATIIQDITHCDPVNGAVPNAEGNIAITAIDEAGTNLTVPFPARYSFLWDDPAAQTTSAAANLLPGSYNVHLTNTNTGCVYDVGAEIEDLTLGTVTVALDTFTSEIHCVDPRLGKLTVQATGSTSGYIFDWTGAVARNFSSGATVDKDSIMTFSAGDVETIRVESKDNNCWATDTYTMDEIITPIVITGNSTPITNCANAGLGIIENGTLHSTVILPIVKNDGVTPVDPATDFTYIWSFNGVDTYTNMQDVSPIDSLTIAGETILVRAVDKADADTRCVSNSQKVFINVERTKPALIATYDLPVTNCNLKPNGSAEASVNGNTIDYTFDWYQGSTATPLLHTGPTFDDMEAYFPPSQPIFYTVLATDVFNGCTKTDTVAVKFKPASLTAPTITLLAKQTSCDLAHPNGSLGADIDGNTAAYSFTWTKDNDGAFGTKVQPIITDLVKCDQCYLVVALDTATGCTSQARGTVPEELTYPDIRLAYINPTCANADGLAAVFVQNATPITIATIEWYESDQLVDLSNVAGSIEASDDYKVVVTSDLGCVTEKKFALKPEVHPHNGISRNNDALNTHFHVDCIDSYPNAQVRIYNRIGTLVYEGNGYDNSTIFFNGNSNKGVSVMGTNLPDGTYYYIIDKRDGSKQLAGYLEIVQ